MDGEYDGRKSVHLHSVAYCAFNSSAMNNNKNAALSTVSENKSGQPPRAKKGKTSNKNNNKNKIKLVVKNEKALKNLPTVEKTQEYKNLQVEVGKLVKSMLDQDQLYLLPRAVPTTVAPHQYHFAREYTPQLDPNGVLKAACVFRPDPDIFMQQTELVAGSTFTFEPIQQVDYKFSPGSTNISLDADILAPNVIKCSTAAVGPSSALMNHFSTNGKKLVSGTKYYPGLWTVPSANFNMTVYNPTNNTITVSGFVGHVDPQGNAVVDYTPVAVAINPHTQNTIAFLSAAANFIAWQAALIVPGTKGVIFGLSFVGAPDSVASGFQADVNIPNMQRDADLVWRNYSLWDLVPESDVARSQFQKAARYSVTGFKILFQNVTAILNRGGGIYAARLPGNTTLDGTIDGIIRTVSAQTHHTLSSNLLEFGAHLPWTPEKIQDWLFQERPEFDPYEGNPLNKPYIVLAMNFASDVNTSPQFVIRGAMTLEYLTMDVSNTFMKSPGYLELLEFMACELSNQEVFSENPEHLKKIAQTIKNVVTSDTFRRFAAGAITAGVKVAPMLLSLL